MGGDGIRSQKLARRGRIRDGVCDMLVISALESHLRLRGGFPCPCKVVSTVPGRSAPWRPKPETIAPVNWLSLRARLYVRGLCRISFLQLIIYMAEVIVLLRENTT